MAKLYALSLFALMIASMCSAGGSSSGGSAPAQAGQAEKASAADSLKRRLQHPPAPLKHLVFSAREGFSLKMISNQQVTAEIRNGAGRTLARGDYNLQAGDWNLRPRNLAPGLYTVLLRTGPNLRALRIKIEDSERGTGSPEWILQKADTSAPAPATAPMPPPDRGASVIPAD